MLLHEEEVFDGGGWKLKKQTADLPDGRTKTIIRAYTCDTVHILACPTPNTVLLLREYRPFYGTYVWMLPSGKMDKETDPMAAAQRELQEETGYRAQDLQPYFRCRFAERIEYVAHIFLASDLVKDPLPQDAYELIEVHEMPIDEAVTKVLQMDPQHVLSASALLQLQRDRTK